METIIKECKKHGQCQHNIDKNGYARCSKCASEATQKRRDKIKILALEYKGGKCSICGYNKYAGALEFHHLDSSTKDFGISEKGYTRSWGIVKEELDKCVLVCANCHRELHKDPIYEELIWTIEDEEISKELKGYFCSCGEKLHKESKTGLCLNCYKKTTRKTERPSKEELFELIKTTSFTELGKQYNVSDNAIRKWCKSYGLPSTKKELKQIKEQEDEKN